MLLAVNQRKYLREALVNLVSDFQLATQRNQSSLLIKTSQIIRSSINFLAISLLVRCILKLSHVYSFDQLPKCRSIYYPVLLVTARQTNTIFHKDV